LRVPQTTKQSLLPIGNCLLVIIQSKAARPLLDRVENNGLKVVLVEDSSRFARDPIAQELGVLMLIKRNPQPVSAVGGRLDPGPLPSRLAGVSLFGSRLHLAKNYQSLGRVFLIKGSLFVSLGRMIRPSSTAVLSQASVAESSVVLPPERAGTNADHSNLFRTAFPAGNPSQHVNCV
jgi:hypothetical protein